MSRHPQAGGAFLQDEDYDITGDWHFTTMPSLFVDPSTPLDLFATVGGVADAPFIQAGSGAVSRTVETKLRELDLHINDFGGLPNGATDTTDAFNKALAVAATSTGKSRTIKFSPGTYRFSTKPNRIGTGVVLQGDGSTGSTDGYGTRLVCDYAIGTATEGFLEWDGSTGSFAGTGGGIRDLQVFRSASFSGGTALKFTGADDNHRAGFNLCFNFIIATLGTTWNKGILIDGTGLDTLGTKGIRETRLIGGHVASCSDADSDIYLLNVVHVYGLGMHLTEGQGICGMTVTGASADEASTNVFFAASNIDGNLTIDHCLDVYYHGRIGGATTTTANSQSVAVQGMTHGSSMPVVSKQKSIALIADAVATTVWTITVPNSANSAKIRVALVGSLGSGGAIGANEASATNTYDIVISRTAGVNAVAAISSAYGASAIAVAGAATVTAVLTIAAVVGAVGATNTFPIKVTITRSGGASTNHTCQTTAEVLNANTAGVLIV